MLILLSPAKTMVGSSRTTVPFVTVPLYKSEAEHIAMEMAGYSVEELSGMLGINRNLALQTKERYNVFHSPDVHGLPALWAYTGIVFRYISPADFTEADFEYAQNHLRMASACYGLTRPLDVIKPYRMEYAVELPSMGIPVSEYWKPLLTDKLIDDTKAAGGILVNLASREIQQSFDWSRINKRVRVITPEFKVYKGDGFKTIVIYAKMMRGAMTRYILKNKISHPDDICSFSAEGFHFSPEHSSENNPVFVV